MDFSSCFHSYRLTCSLISAISTISKAHSDLKFLIEVESSRMPSASRTHFEVLGLGLGFGLEVSSPRKLLHPRLKDSTIFWVVKSLWRAWKIFWKTVFSGDRLKNFSEDLFFGEHLCLCPCPWPRAFLVFALKGSVLGRADLGLGLGFFLYPWPWPRVLCPRLHVCYLMPIVPTGYHDLTLLLSYSLSAYR